MEGLFVRQGELVAEIQRIGNNFDKDSANRKTSSYLKTRLESLENLWGEFELNNSKLATIELKTQNYFTDSIYERIHQYYSDLRAKLSTYQPYVISTPILSNTKMLGTTSSTSKATGTGLENENDKIVTLMSLQQANFRAFKRILFNIDIEDISEKWELEDELRSIQTKWDIIDKQHIELDYLLEGKDDLYQSDFLKLEKSFKSTKRALNQKLSATAHIHKATPSLEIPIFSGRYSNWPTFFDLFNESIHRNNYLSKAQKMQHLKGKVKGEAERLISHLNISSDNYDIAWEILSHRYNNPHVLFTTQIETFLNQPSISHQTSFEIKRLYDTTTECIHAIDNLGINTNTWDPILAHLITKKLDSETYTQYKEARKSPRDLASLDELMRFLENKFMALEPVQKKDSKKDKEILSSTDKPASYYPSKPYYKKSFNYNKLSKGHQTAAVTSLYKCPLCNSDHQLYRCQQFIQMPAEMQLRTVENLKLCKNCLFKHVNNKCISIKRCKECNNEHHTILHDSCAGPSQIIRSNVLPMTSSKKPHVANHVSTDDEEVLLATVLLQIKAVDGNYVTLRALLDQGSQITLISENAAQLLGLPRRKFSASVSGVGNSSNHSKSSMSLECKSIYNNYSFHTEGIVIPRVISDLPNASFTKRSWSHIQHMQLADPEYNVSKPIDILLDACVYSDVIMSGLVKGTHNAPIAQQTKLGWILSGNVKTFNCSVVVNNLKDIAQYWEMEDLPSPASDLTESEHRCEEHYVATTRRLDNGRYEVALPMTPGYEEKLGHSKSKATAQFIQVERKMARNEAFALSYRQFMREYLELGHMRLANYSKGPKYVLPHHAVIKEDSTTTKIRVVFNGSSPTSTGISLNDVMECGPNLQHDLPALILKWRLHTYVITADIEKMFRQIMIRESNQHLQTIMWRETPHEQLREYVLTTITYGTKAAPYLAMRTLRQLAKDEASRYPLAAKALQHDFYMDDLLSGGNTLEETKKLQQQLIEVMKGAGMNLRKWSSNEPQLLESISSELIENPLDFKHPESRKTLGISWKPTLDSFMFTNKIEITNKCNTKRKLLSEISTIFDPLGWISPLTIRAKLLFQQTWSLNLGWDDEVPNDIVKEWTQFRVDLQKIDQVNIPRHLGNTTKRFQLHGYSDASEKAYAGAIYLVTSNCKGEFTSRLVIAKTKLAPLNQKNATIPRLELCGALLLAQLMKIVIALLENYNYDVYAWTDSEIVLGWLHGDTNRWKSFVSNRVNKITAIIPASKWNYVKSKENAADCATRGLSFEKLQDNTLWWNGPEYLINFDPSIIIDKTYKEPSLETKRINVNAALQQPNSSIINNLIENNSSITRLVRTLAWISRFIATVRRHTTEHDSYLSTSEINNANLLIIKNVQAQNFEIDLTNIKNKGHVHTSSKIANLNPYIDENGVLRVGGRLNFSNISNTAKHPIILPNHCRYTDLLINQAHITTLHGGPRLTLAYLREHYWIISGMRTVKKQLRLCVTCRRFSSDRTQQIMADLPKARVTPSRPFTHTGVDFTGHVILKMSTGRGVRTQKGYVAVFVCLATKAVHLELVSDLSTSSFLAALHRFCARRGTPRRIYSDNGTNFIGAKRVLDKEYKAIIQTINQDFFSNISHMNIEWSFNAPAWPSAGGIWEAAVKSFKRHLKRVLGEQKLTYEEFTTLLQQIEACLNSRPLTALTENPEDPYLSPGHFLIGDTLLSRPQTDSDNISLPARWQLVQNMKKQFWKIWSSDYLQQLQIRSKWRTPTKNFVIDDIVLIKEDNLPPGKWAMGRVLDLHPGQDGFVRVVSIKTENNILKRPITKLVPLPVENSNKCEQTLSTASSNQQSRAKTKKISRNFFTLALLMLTTIISPVTSNTFANKIEIKDNRTLYFDKISDLQFIQDEWKLVVYYNLTNYWHSIAQMEITVNYLKNLTAYSYHNYKEIIDQLAHELTEIEHYNRLLQGNNKRQRRGLINGAGSLANYLFGVLDDNFAQKYTQDINMIKNNENHLKQLIGDQITIIEANSNIIQRNEQIMNKQFSTINEHLHNITIEINKFRSDLDVGLYTAAATLSASIILGNLRRIQDTLIDTVTDISHGRIDTHLLTSEQLEEQMNFILGQLQDDLKLPVELSNIRDLYKLLKVLARVYQQYLIIEIKIPLVKSETYELDNIISIPHIVDKRSHLTIPVYPYLAFNLRKDEVVFLSQQDLQTCIHASEDKLLCTLNKPIYDLHAKQNLCNITLINTSKYTTPCTYEQTPCVNRWIKLHRQNVWLYSCCEKCNIRTFCPADSMTMNTVLGNGLLDVGQGCIIKSDTFTIHAHNNFLRKVNVEPTFEAPEISILNEVINTSTFFDLTTENHKQQYQQVAKDLALLKQGISTPNLSTNDIHHYSISYGTLVVLLLVATTALVLYIRDRHRKIRELSSSVGRSATRSGGGAATTVLPLYAPTRQQPVLSDSGSGLANSVSIASSNRGISPPKPPRSVIPTELYGESAPNN